MIALSRSDGPIACVTLSTSNQLQYFRYSDNHNSKLMKECIRSGGGVVNWTGVLQSLCPALFTAATLALYCVCGVRLSNVFSLLSVDPTDTVACSWIAPLLCNSSTLYTVICRKVLLHGVVHPTRTKL